jgi:hypothetical protein
LILGGCQFVVPGFEVPGPSSDGGPTSYDFASVDLALADLTAGADLALADSAPADLAKPHDLSEAACGESGQPCCAKGTACVAADNLACNNNVCTACAASGVKCCPGTGKPAFPFCIDNHFCNFMSDKCN